MTSLRCVWRFLYFSKINVKIIEIWIFLHKYLSGCIKKLFYLLNKLWFIKSRIKLKMGPLKISFARIIHNFKIHIHILIKEKSKCYSRWRFVFDIFKYLAIFWHIKFCHSTIVVRIRLCIRIKTAQMKSLLASALSIESNAERQDRQICKISPIVYLLMQSFASALIVIAQYFKAVGSLL